MPLSTFHRLSPGSTMSERWSQVASRQRPFRRKPEPEGANEQKPNRSAFTKRCMRLTKRVLTLLPRAREGRRGEGDGWVGVEMAGEGVW